MHRNHNKQGQNAPADAGAMLSDESREPWVAEYYIILPGTSEFAWDCVIV